MIILGLQGSAGAGKTTFADYLSDRRGFEQYSFADPLKQLCADMFGWDSDRLNELAYKEEQDPKLPAGWTRRKVLQFVGTDCFRTIDPEFWIKLGLERIEAISRWFPTTPGVVIPDCRFANEVEAIRKLGGFIVRLRRPGFVGTLLDQHASEQEWRGVEPDLDLAPAEGVEAVRRAADMALTWVQSHPRTADAGQSCR